MLKTWCIISRYVTKLLAEPRSVFGASAGPAACPSEVWISATDSVALAEGCGEGANILKYCAFAPVECFLLVA